MTQDWNAIMIMTSCYSSVLEVSSSVWHVKKNLKLCYPGKVMTRDLQENVRKMIVEISNW